MALWGRRYRVVEHKLLHALGRDGWEDFAEVCVARFARVGDRERAHIHLNLHARLWVLVHLEHGVLDREAEQARLFQRVHVDGRLVIQVEPHLVERKLAHQLAEGAWLRGRPSFDRLEGPCSIFLRHNVGRQYVCVVGHRQHGQAAQKGERQDILPLRQLHVDVGHLRRELQRVLRRLGWCCGCLGHSISRHRRTLGNLERNVNIFEQGELMHVVLLLGFHACHQPDLPQTRVKHGLCRIVFRGKGVVCIQLAQVACHLVVRAQVMWHHDDWCLDQHIIPCEAMTRLQLRCLCRRGVLGCIVHGLHLRKLGKVCK